QRSIPSCGEVRAAREIRPLLALLGLPTFGLAFALSTLTSYGPSLLLEKAHDPGVVGAILGGEGALALCLPLVSGWLSDRLPPTRLGKRLPFVLLGAPMALAGLVLLPLSVNLLVASIAVGLFFVGYYLYYPPYRALYADLLPRHLYARSQASQGVLRGVGLGVALLAGGFFLDLWKPLPFVVAGSLLLATTLALAPVSRLQKPVRHEAPIVPSVREVLRSKGMRTFAAANALLELSFAGLRSFIVLYVTKGLGHSTTVASAVIGVVAVAYIVGAPLAGALEKRFGIIQVMTWSGALYGVGLIAGALPTTLAPELVLLPFVALAGSVLLTLPQALAFLVAPPGSEGEAAGLVDVSRGVGIVLGPLLVGWAVRFFGSWFPETHGYAALWPVIGVGTLAAVPLLWRLEV
ncbi:MAG: MFS transporter, partial [Mycobacteriales bacterium]